MRGAEPLVTATFTSDLRAAAANVAERRGRAQVTINLAVVVIFSTLYWVRGRGLTHSQRRCLAGLVPSATRPSYHHTSLPCNRRIRLLDNGQCRACPFPVEGVGPGDHSAPITPCMMLVLVRLR